MIDVLLKFFNKVLYYVIFYIIQAYPRRFEFFVPSIAGTVSIEQSIANTFQLRAYKDVIVKKVDPKVTH